MIEPHFYSFGRLDQYVLRPADAVDSNLFEIAGSESVALIGHLDH